MSNSRVMLSPAIFPFVLLLCSLGKQETLACIWCICSLYIRRKNSRETSDYLKLIGPKVTGVGPGLPRSWGASGEVGLHMRSDCRTISNPVCTNGCPFSDSRQDQLGLSEVSLCPRHAGLSPLPKNLPPDHSFSQWVLSSLLLTASFSGKVKGQERPKGRGWCLQRIYLGQALEQGSLPPGFRPHPPARGWIMKPEEDVACGDSCPHSPRLADRQAGLGQK